MSNTVDELIVILQTLKSHTNENHTSKQIAAAASYDWKTKSDAYEKLIADLVSKRGTSRHS